MSDSNDNVFFFFRLSLTLQFLLIFAFVAIVIGGVFAYFHFSKEETTFVESSPRASSTRTDLNVLADGGSIPWNRFIEDVYTAHGGRAHFERLLTLRKTGSLYYGEEVLDVIFAYKRPGMIRYRLLNQQQIAITFSYDGQTAWSQLERTLNPLPARILAGNEALAVVRNSVASRHFLEFIAEGFRPRITGLVERNGEQMIRVEMPATAERTQYFLIDAKTLWVRSNVWTESSLDGDGTVTMEVHYDDYRMIDGYPCAHLEVVVIDGRQLNRFEIQQFEVNPGILNAYFSPPSR